MVARRGEVGSLARWKEIDPSTGDHKGSPHSQHRPRPYRIIHPNLYPAYFVKIYKRHLRPSHTYSRLIIFARGSMTK